MSKFKPRPHGKHQKERPQPRKAKAQRLKPPEKKPGKGT